AKLTLQSSMRGRRRLGQPKDGSSVAPDTPPPPHSVHALSHAKIPAASCAFSHRASSSRSPHPGARYGPLGHYSESERDDPVVTFGHNCHQHSLRWFSSPDLGG